METVSTVELAKDQLNQWIDNGMISAGGKLPSERELSELLGPLVRVVVASDHGGERGALLYSLIGTCKLNGVEPENYLRHVLDVIADWPVTRVSELLPWRVTLASK